jgi:UDP-2-acetamido-3-amino-2,3-dideoxy-glucuronate N-acetyltransferase
MKVADQSSNKLDVKVQKLRIAQIGAGYWGRNLVRSFSALGVLRAIADVDIRCATELAEKYAVAQVTADYRDVIGSPDIDAVAIATPAETHGRIAAACLAAGKHVFVEKPLCLDVAEAGRLAADAAARGLTLMVGHVLLYHPAFVALRAAVAAGQIGRLRYVYSHRLSLGKIRTEENALWSFAPHDISMILALTGRLPERVATHGGAYLSPGIADSTVSYLTFPDGVQAHIFVSWLHPYKDHRMIVIGSDGMIVFDDTAVGAAKLQLYRHLVNLDGPVPTVDKVPSEPLAYDAAEPLAIECAHFLQCVANRTTPISDGREGIGVLRVLDACQRALVAGMPQTVE